MKRRAFVTGLGAVLAGPPGAGAQQTAEKIARVGILSPTAPLPGHPFSLAGELSRRLHELGWIEGKNLAIEQRYAHGRPDRLAALAAELVRANVDVIVAVSPPAIGAAKGAGPTVPTVMAFSGIDPVRAGFVASLGRPGGSVTGVAILAIDVTVKRLEVLKAAVPNARRIAVILNPRNPGTNEQFAALKTAAPALGVDVQPVAVERPGDYSDASAAIARTQPDALLVPSDPNFFRDARALVDLARKRRIAACYEWREFAEIGGLMSFGPSIRDLAARVSAYVDKILRGARPADLPVEQPTTFELVINLKTAKALDLTIPPSLLARADQVLE